MKILTVCHDYLPAHPGGAELHAHQISRALAARGHDVRVAFTERHLDRAEGEVTRGEFEGLPTYEVVHHREYEDVGDVLRQERSHAAFRGLLEEIRPDVVHFHHAAFWGTACIVAARDSGATVVVTLHDYFLLCEASVLLRRDGSICERGSREACGDCMHVHPLLPERWGVPAAEVQGTDRDALYERVAAERRAQHARDIRAAHAVLCPSAFLGRRFRAAGLCPPELQRTLPLGCPGELHAPRVSDPARPLRVGYVGGIYSSKGVHVLMQAARQLAGEPLEFHVHGVLEWFPDYVAELRQHAAGANVSFHGRFDASEVDRVLAGVDLLVVPSLWYENMPLTIQEAFRNGLPVLVSDLGSMPEIVRDGAGGRSFPPGDATALANLLRELAADREQLARLAAGRPHVSSIDEAVDAHEALYAELRGR